MLDGLDSTGAAKVRVRADTNTDMMTSEACMVDDWSLRSFE